MRLQISATYFPSQHSRCGCPGETKFQNFPRWGYYHASCMATPSIAPPNPPPTHLLHIAGAGQIILPTPSTPSPPRLRVKASFTRPGVSIMTVVTRGCRRSNPVALPLPFYRRRTPSLVVTPVSENSAEDMEREAGDGRVVGERGGSVLTSCMSLVLAP